MKLTKDERHDLGEFVRAAILGVIFFAALWWAVCASMKADAQPSPACGVSDFGCSRFSAQNGTAKRPAYGWSGDVYHCGRNVGPDGGFGDGGTLPDGGPVDAGCNGGLGFYRQPSQGGASEAICVGFDGGSVGCFSSDGWSGKFDGGAYVAKAGDTMTGGLATPRIDAGLVLAGNGLGTQGVNLGSSRLCIETSCQTRIGDDGNANISMRVDGGIKISLQPGGIVAIVPIQANTPGLTGTSGLDIGSSASPFSTDWASRFCPWDGGTCWAGQDTEGGVRVVSCDSKDFGGTSAGTCDDISCTVASPAVVDGTVCAIGAVAASWSSNTTFQCFVSDTSTVKLRRCCNNLVSACADIASANYKVTLISQ